MVAFLSSILAMVVIVAIAMRVGRKRPVGAPYTWGEAMVGGTWAFLGMFLAYGLVPHYWLTWAEAELKWRPDTFLYDYPWFGVKLGFLKPQDMGGWFPMHISMQTIRDLIAVVIYVILLGGQMWLWAWWQKRDKKPVAEVARSDYGRPLVKRA